MSRTLTARVECGRRGRLAGRGTSGLPRPIRARPPRPYPLSLPHRPGLSRPRLAAQAPAAAPTHPARPPRRTLPPSSPMRPAPMPPRRGHRELRRTGPCSSSTARSATTPTDWAGGVAFDTMTPEEIREDAETWEKAMRKLRGRLMPPPGKKQPDPADAIGIRALDGGLAR